MNYKTKILARVLFVFVFTGIAFTQFESEPKAVIHPMEYDFGDIIQDSVVATNFIITNEGSDLLKINKVWASCGCTAVMPVKNELLSGESTDIKVTFDSKGKLGKQNKTVYVETNDPNNSKIQLRITGNIIKVENHTRAIN